MIRSVSLINFKEGTDQRQRDAVLAAYRKLPALIPGIVSFEVGLDQGLLQGNAGIAVIAGFASREDFLAYSTHQAHTDVIFPVCGPVMAGWSSVQFEA
jgi:hypothetical protein